MRVSPIQILHQPDPDTNSDANYNENDVKCRN